MKPVVDLCNETQQVHNAVNICTWNINGFWSKVQEVYNLVDKEKIVVIGLQETLARHNHYVPKLEGYRSYTSPAKEDFRGIATFINEKLASYEVPHGLRWLIHVKVFGYMGWQGPTHFLNIYLKSGGNYRKERSAALTEVKNIVN